MTILGFLSLILKLPKKLFLKATEDHVNSLIDSRLNSYKDSTDQQLKEIKNLIQQISSDLNSDREATRAALRHSITYIYQKYLPQKCLPPNIKKDLCSLYEAYEILKGNSYIHEIYEEMMRWDVK